MKTYLTQMITQALRKAAFTFNPADVFFEKPKNDSHGDFSTNIALKIAKENNLNPRVLAEKIIENLEDPKEIINPPELAGPGFINFSFKPDYYIHLIQSILKSPQQYGRSEIGKGKKVMVEFVSANPTGPLTIGHGRQAVLGDTIANLKEWVGYEVDREYYFNNAGRQMRVLGDSVRLRYLELHGKEVQFPDDYYQGAYIIDIADQLKQEYGDRLIDEENLTVFTQKAETVIFEDIKSSLHRLGISHDVYYNENSLYENGHIETTLLALRENNALYEKEGATWFKTTNYGQEQDKVLVKSTGEPTYRLPDIAYHIQKFSRGYDEIIDIFGADHIATYPDVLLALKILGYPEEKITVLIHQFVTVTQHGEVVKMSTRKANFITLDWLTDEAGPDVVRYFFLMRGMGAHLNFDLDLAKKEGDENPVFYLQYAHARIASIVRKATSEGLVLRANFNAGFLRDKEEQDLIKQILNFSDVVESAAEQNDSLRLINYLTDLAAAFHRFYHNHFVIGVEKEMGEARLALCEATRITLKNGFEIIGISAPDRM